MTHLDRTLRSQIEILFSTIPGIRDGNPDAIHDARVATRRLRATLPLACARADEDRVSAARRVVRQAGRALGRARDVDVLLEQLRAVEQKLPAAARAIGSLRELLDRRQQKEHRRLVRKCEQLELAALTACAQPRATMLRTDRRWSIVERTVIEQSRRLHEAVVAASGVYFPDRTHLVRVDVKRLRYVLELVPHSGMKPILKQLRRAQEVLGHLHDRQTILDTLPKKTGALREEFELLEAFVRAETLELHRQYLAFRDDLLGALEELSRHAAARAWRPSVAKRWFALGAIALPPIALAVHHAAVQRPAGDPFSQHGQTRWRAEFDPEEAVPLLTGRD